MRYRDLQFNVDNITNAKTIISQAKAILIIAGAGMSSDSGLNVFRSVNDGDKLLGAGHVYRNEDIDYQKKPEIAWYYDSSIKRDAYNHEPHQGYYQLLNFLNTHCPNYFVLTSNIDNYFIRSGYDSNRVYETHGSIEYIQCGKLTVNDRCKGVFPWKMMPTIDDKLLLCTDTSTFPQCPSCGGTARANISHLPDLQEDIDQTYKGTHSLIDLLVIYSLAHFYTGAQQFLFMEWLHKERINNRKNHGDSLVIVEIGSGSSIHGLRHESEILLSSHPYSGVHNAHLIRVDPLLESVPNSTTNVVGIKDSALSAIKQLFT